MAKTTYSNEIKFNVAGVTHDGRQGKLAALSRDNGSYLTLRREKTNAFDANAIAIIATLTTGTHMKLGYVPAKIAESLAPVIDAGGKTRVRDHEVVGGGRFNRGCKVTLAY